MELFVLFSIFLSFCNPLLGVEAGFRVWDCSTALIVSLCLYAVIYVFKAIALSTMAKNSFKRLQLPPLLSVHKRTLANTREAQMREDRYVFEELKQKILNG